MTTYTVGLTHWITNYGNTLTFTANNAVTSQPITLAGLPNLGRTSALVYFPYGDNCLIESISLVLPFQYSGGEMPPPSVRLGWVDKAANNGNLVEFGANGEFSIPEYNQPWDVYNMINMPAGVAAAQPWGIRILAVSGLWANQINGPAILNGTTQACRVFLKVRHTLDMVS
jgi:hypothetical protein